MGSIQSYKDLIVWQKSIELVKEVYQFSDSFPEEEKFGLTAQVRRSAVSISSNIAEGWGRGVSKSYIQFLRIAKGSLFELETQLVIVKELKTLEGIGSKIDELIVEISKMLTSMIKKLIEKGY